MILAELFSIATLKTSLGCTTLLFKFPTDITSCLIILFAVFKQITINFSFNSSFSKGIKNSAISSGEVIFLSENHFDCDWIRLLISKAASNVTALSFPIPIVLVRCESELDASEARFLFLLINSCATVITDLPLLPVLKRIAISSASVKFWAPLNFNFSLGLSSNGSSLIL